MTAKVSAVRYDDVPSTVGHASSFQESLPKEVKRLNPSGYEIQNAQKRGWTEFARLRIGAASCESTCTSHGTSVTTPSSDPASHQRQRVLRRSNNAVHAAKPPATKNPVMWICPSHAPRTPQANAPAR